MRSFEETALAFDRSCAAAGVGYALIRGMAVNAWGRPRTTADVDALVVLEPSRTTKLVEALTREGLRVTSFDFESAFRDRSHVSVFDAESTLHIDVKLALSEDERVQVRDAVDLPFEGGRLRVARPEDTVAYKLRFGSPQDLADAEGIVQRQGKRLDRERLERLAARLGVLRQLQVLLAEQGPP